MTTHDDAPRVDHRSPDAEPAEDRADLVTGDAAADWELPPGETSIGVFDHFARELGEAFAEASAASASRRARSASSSAASCSSSRRSSAARRSAPSSSPVGAASIAVSRRSSRS